MSAHGIICLAFRSRWPFFSSENQVSVMKCWTKSVGHTQQFLSGVVVVVCLTVREQEVFYECCGALHKSIKWQLITKRSDHLLGNLRYVSKGYSSIMFNIDFLFQAINFSKLVSHLKGHLHISCNEISQREKWCVILFCCQPAEVNRWVTVTKNKSVFVQSIIIIIKRGKERNIVIWTAGLCCHQHIHLNIKKKDSKAQT